MKYGVRMIIAPENVLRDPWGCFWQMDRALRAYGPWPRGELGQWELVWAEERHGDWVVSFQCWSGT